MTSPILFAYDARHHRLQVTTPTHYTWYRLGHPPANDIYASLADILVKYELHRLMDPPLQKRVEELLAHDVKHDIRAWTPRAFRELLETVRIEFGRRTL